MNKKQYEYLQSLSVKQFNAKASSNPPKKSHRSADYTHSMETRRKISEATKGRASPCGMNGKTHSEETRQFLSKLSKGIIRTEETRKLMSLNSGMKKAVITPLGEFPSLKEAAITHGFYSGEKVRIYIRKGVEGYRYKD